MAEDGTTTTTQAAEDKEWREKRLNAEIDKRRESDKRAAEAERVAAEERARREELEDKEKPHIERLTKENEKLVKRLAEASDQLAQMESSRVVDQKRSWVQAAAAKANFHDPNEAALLADLEGIEDPKGAEAAVKAMAKDRPWAVRVEQAEGARLRRVGADGQVEEDKGVEQITPEEQEQRWGEEMFTGLMGKKPTQDAEAS